MVSAHTIRILKISTVLKQTEEGVKENELPKMTRFAPHLVREYLRALKTAYWKDLMQCSNCGMKFPMKEWRENKYICLNCGHNHSKTIT